MESFYIQEDLDTKFKSTHIEVKQANLEILPENRTWPQTLGYLHTALYLAFFIGILYFFSKLLMSFSAGRPFESVNVKLLRWIGLLTIGIAVYEFLIGVVVSFIFSEKFSIANALIPTTPSFWEVDFIALFLGFIFVALSSAFKTGTELQELEDLTV